MVKYIFVTGGVLSGLGKGIIASSIGLLVKSMGLNVTAIKFDPYINVDAGTMSPYAHGEVFVTEDGGETDMDIGHYERFLDIDLSKKNNITSGQIYLSVILKEREGRYLGECVQIIPHVTNEIKERIREVARESNADVVIVEIGGTVGDIEGLPFQEAARQMRLEEDVHDTFFVHVALAPILPSGEVKTKPIQHSVQELRRIGIQPDAIVIRSHRQLEVDVKSKISLHSNVPLKGVFSCPYTETPYEIPLILYEQGFLAYLTDRLNLPRNTPDLGKWIEFVKRLRYGSKKIRVAMIGKYTKIKDSYVSIIEALNHASAWSDTRVELKWIESSYIERQDPESIKTLDDVDGAIVLPGFGRRGAEGKITAIRYLRENNIPLLGICFGMQLMTIDIARNLAGLRDANSTEIDPNTPHPVIDLLPGQREISRLGGTQRLGAYKIYIENNTLAWSIYRSREVYERHRHRYGLNPRYIDVLESAGLKISGYSEEKYPEIIELKDNRGFYLGTQAHPEFKSRPLRPSPVFLGFVKYILEKRIV